MQKIGIVTLYGDYNLGNKLQNYAVQTFFEQMGYECRTIPHQDVSSNTFFQGVKLKIIKAIGYPKDSALKLRQYDKRKNGFKEFSQKYLKLDSCVNYYHLPANLSSRYDYFVVGSDQVWHNWTNKREELDFYFLRFARKNQRLTMAPSFGVASIAADFREIYCQGLLGLSNITCREEQGVDIIKGLTGQEATAILDPTMLVDKRVWNLIEKKPTYLPDKYMLVYILGKKSSEMQKSIIETAKKRNLTIVDIYDPQKTELYFTTPDEFVYYIHHAQFVMTDSFHATVFSILYYTNFVVFDRCQNKSGNMSSRLDTLLERFSLTDRKFNGCTDMAEADFSAVSGVMQREREKAEKIYRDTFERLDKLR